MDIFHNPIVSTQSVKLLPCIISTSNDFHLAIIVQISHVTLKGLPWSIINNYGSENQKIKYRMLISMIYYNDQILCWARKTAGIGKRNKRYFNVKNKYFYHLLEYKHIKDREK